MYAYLHTRYKTENVVKGIHEKQGAELGLRVEYVGLC